MRILVASEKFAWQLVVLLMLWSLASNDIITRLSAIETNLASIRFALCLTKRKQRMLSGYVS